jgi:hypothetical protein
MAFVPAYAGQVPSKETKHCQRCKDPSRRAFTIGAAALVAAHVIGPVRAQPEVDDAVTWAKEELCYVCGGRGQVPCMLCDGTGKFAVDDGVVVDRAVQCPNCGGSKVVGVPCCGACEHCFYRFARGANSDMVFIVLDRVFEMHRDWARGKGH